MKYHIKTLFNVILRKIKPYAEIIGDYHWRFRSRKLTIDCIFTLMYLIDKYYKFNKHLHLFQPSIYMVQLTELLYT